MEKMTILIAIILSLSVQQCSSKCKDLEKASFAILRWDHSNETTASCPAARGASVHVLFKESFDSKDALLLFVTRGSLDCRALENEDATFKPKTSCLRDEGNLSIVLERSGPTAVLICDYINSESQKVFLITDPNVEMTESPLSTTTALPITTTMTKTTATSPPFSHLTTSPPFSHLTTSPPFSHLTTSPPEKVYKDLENAVKAYKIATIILSCLLGGVITASAVKLAITIKKNGCPTLPKFIDSCFKLCRMLQPKVNVSFNIEGRNQEEPDKKKERKEKKRDNITLEDAISEEDQSISEIISEILS